MIKENEKLKKMIEMIKKKKKILILVVLAIGLSSIGGYIFYRNNQVKEVANKSVKILESGDIQQISQLIFEYSSEEQNDSSILSVIFAGIDVNVKNVDGKNVNFIVQTKDLSQFFSDAEETGENFTTDSLLNYLKDYREKAEKQTFEASVPYERIDGEIIIDYSNDSMIDALSGRLMTSYQELYKKILDEYREEISE